MTRNEGLPGKHAAPGMRLHARHWVEGDGSASRVTLSLQFSGLLGPLFARLTRNLNDRYLALEANGLKERIEKMDPSVPVVS